MDVRKEDMMLLDIQYIKPNKRNKTPDYLYIIWKDISTLKKHLWIIPEPELSIYFEKPEYRTHSFNKCDAPLSTLEERKVKYSNVIYEIAKEMGSRGQSLLNEAFAQSNYRKIKEIFLYPYSFGADIDIRAFYRMKWLEKYDNNTPKPITKGFLDIEVDIMESYGAPDPVYNPIDLVTLIDNTTKISYTFALIGVGYTEKSSVGLTAEEIIEEENKKAMYDKRIEQQEYWSTHIGELKEKAHAMFDESYPDFRYEFYFYTEEPKMLVHLFQLINQLKLDFIEIWNISFDIPFIINRLKTFGLDPAEVMCPKDFPVKECWFKVDKRNFMIKNKGDYFHLSSYTIFTDQMINYAAIRKGGGELRSNKLTYVAKKEVRDEKLDYSEIGNIKTLSYNDYLTYVLYNIKDVLLQYGIEKKTSDLDTYYITSYANATPYESIFRQIIKLRNVQYMSFKEQGLVPGNNINAILNTNYDGSNDDEEDEKFEGALVGNPNLIDHFGMELYGKHTNNIFLYSIDFDMSRFYPSTIGEMNIYPPALIFKMQMDANQFTSRAGDLPYHGITDVQLVENQEDTFSGDIGKEVIDNFQTRNYLAFGRKWFNLPTASQIYQKLEEELD